MFFIASETGDSILEIDGCRTAHQAASKVASSLENDQVSIVTIGRKDQQGKMYMYRCSKIKLDTPVRCLGKTLTYKNDVVLIKTFRL